MRLRFEPVASGPYGKRAKPFSDPNLRRIGASRRTRRSRLRFALARLVVLDGGQSLKTDPTVTVACSSNGRRVAIRSGVRLTLHDLN